MRNRVTKRFLPTRARAIGRFVPVLHPTSLNAIAGRRLTGNPNCSAAAAAGDRNRVSRLGRSAENHLSGSRWYSALCAHDDRVR